MTRDFVLRMCKGRTMLKLQALEHPLRIHFGPWIFLNLGKCES